MAAAGCTVSFQEHVGEIVHTASGRRLPLVRREGVYLLELRVSSKPSGAPGRPRPASVSFPRQGQ